MTKTGTPEYNAPEIYTETEYSEKVDVWSAGVILYSLLSGSLLFDSKNITTLIENIKH